MEPFFKGGGHQLYVLNWDLIILSVLTGLHGHVLICGLQLPSYTLLTNM